jgi:multidrug efflux system membrane fusion protein
VRVVDAGNIVHAADATGLVTVATLKPIDVLFTLPQQALGAVQRAMAAGGAEVLAIPQGEEGGAPEHGVLTVVDNQVDPTTGTVKLKASFANDRLRLWPGAFVTVRLRAETRHDAVVVPPVAVQRGPKGPYLFVVVDGKTVSRRTVTVGPEDVSATIIAEGLQPGEQVVVDGAARLSDNSKVTVLPPTPPADAPVARKAPARPGTPG